MPRAVYVMIILLVFGILCGGSINPAGVQSVKKVATAETTAIPLHVQAVTVATPPPWILVSIVSVPTGADVRIDGSPAPVATPTLVRLAPGAHTIVISKSGYHDYTTTVDLVFGMEEQYLMANLVSYVSPYAVQTKSAGLQVTGVRTFLPTPTTPAGAIPLTLERQQVLATTAPPQPVDCPPSNWSCMPVSEAEKTLGIPYRVYGDTPCGYLADGNRNVPEYCCQKASFSGDLTSAGMALSSRNVHVINQSHQQAGNTRPEETMKPLGIRVQSTQDPISSFLSLLSGFFGGKVGCGKTGQIKCSGTCIDVTTDPQNCGECGMTCIAPATCCDGTCVNVNTTSYYCGSCGVSCQGLPLYHICCQGTCTEIWSNDDNCGLCGRTCGPGTHCQDAFCYSGTGSPV